MSLIKRWVILVMGIRSHLQSFLRCCNKRGVIRIDVGGRLRRPWLRLWWLCSRICMLSIERPSRRIRRKVFAFRSWGLILWWMRRVRFTCCRSIKVPAFRQRHRLTCLSRDFLSRTRWTLSTLTRRGKVLIYNSGRKELRRKLIISNPTNTRLLVIIIKVKFQNWFWVIMNRYFHRVILLLKGCMRRCCYLWKRIIIRPGLVMWRGRFRSCFRIRGNLFHHN